MAALLSLLLVPVLMSCARRQDAEQARLELVGAWSGVYDEVADISVGGELLFVSSNERRGVLLFDLDHEAAPAPVGGFTDLDSLYSAEDAYFLSSYLYADSLLFLKLETNLLAFNVADPFQPDYVRTIFASGVNNEFGLSEDGFHYLYYSDRSDGLTVLRFLADLAGTQPGDDGRWFWDGAQPGTSDLGFFGDYENDGNDLVVQGDLLYLADGRYGLEIFRLTGERVPMTVELLSVLRLPGDALRLAVDDGLAAVALGGAGLAAVDVSDPSRPYLRSLLEPGGTVLDVELALDHAFIANSSKGTRVVDLRDPALPHLRWEFESGYARRLRLANGRIYVADRDEGLLILDNPLE